jgi:hypothetical protein
MQRRSVCLGVFAGLAFLHATAQPAAADPLPRPTGEVILTISGNIRAANTPEGAEFDLAMLEKLGLTQLRTGTAWTSGPSLFEGVRARDVLALVGAEGQTIEATAINDYTITIPMSDLQAYDVLLALKMDGQYLQTKDKGPIWVVYPRDQHSELQDSQDDKKWIWQLSNLVVD